MAPQRRISKQTTAKTSGGTRLQELRRAAGLSLLDLVAKLNGDHEKSIDAAHILTGWHNHHIVWRTHGG